MTFELNVTVSWNTTGPDAVRLLVRSDVVVIVEADSILPAVIFPVTSRFENEPPGNVVDELKDTFPSMIVLPVI